MGQRMPRNMSSTQLIIFCDGGVGNRINSLISGLALAKYFNLHYCVHWPENNWCAAKFDDIFKTAHPISTVSIKNLNGKLDDAIMLLHDEIASTALNVVFNSAYGYASLQDFEEKVIARNQSIFYYPAVVPEWIPIDLVNQQLQALQFTDFIQKEVSDFITNIIGQPFYGLHLRRTDLNVGLTDHEVLTLVTRHKDKGFFVCSDDPVAEALASAHPNVHRREKKSYVQKKSAQHEWLAQSQDDDGRTYFGNISRSRESVIEGTIDMLILAHSEIIGYSGSTFQRMARSIGELCPIIPHNNPEKLNYFSPSELKRQILSKIISTETIINICNSIANQGDTNIAIELLEFSLDTANSENQEKILLSLSIYCLSVKKLKIAEIYLRKIIIDQPKNYSAWLHLAYAHLLQGEYMNSTNAYTMFVNKSPKIISKDEQLIVNLIVEHIKT